jgi:hypothetical protein
MIHSQNVCRQQISKKSDLSGFPCVGMKGFCYNGGGGNMNEQLTCHEAARAEDCLACLVIKYGHSHSHDDHE